MNWEKNRKSPSIYDIIFRFVGEWKRKMILHSDAKFFETSKITRFMLNLYRLKGVPELFDFFLIKEYGVKKYIRPLESAIKEINYDPTNVLDMATGTGICAYYLSKHFPKTSIVAVDLSQEMINRALENCKDRKRIDFRVGDSKHLHYPDNSFDLVVTMNAPFSPLEMKRLLKKDKAVVLVWSYGRADKELSDTLKHRFMSAGFREVSLRNVENGFYLIAKK